MHPDLTNQQIDQINEALDSGNKIEAIKLYREATGQGLKEAKDFIERLQVGLAGDPIPPPPAAGVLDHEQTEKMHEAIFAGSKIEAIKIYRAATGAGLKDSKQYVERVQARLREESPAKFTRSSGAGCGAAMLVLFVAAIAVICIAAV